jgi:hypothetical protein
VALLPRRSLVWCIAGVLAGAMILLSPEPLTAQSGPSANIPLEDIPATSIPSAIVVGFVGGFVHVDDLRHGEVKMVEQLRATYGERVRVELFENREEAEAHKLVLYWLDSNRDGSLSGQEKHRIPIILFGNSWGASMVISLARELKADEIPVLLTIQVDSIRKHRGNDSIIPANVAEAVNYYQSRGILHGCKKITAEDASRTKILGNFRLQYNKEPAEYWLYPWYDRFLTKGHIEIDSDPLVWAEVQRLIQIHLPSSTAER